MTTEHDGLKPIHQLLACLIATNRHGEVEEVMKRHGKGGIDGELQYYLGLTYAWQEKIDDALIEVNKVLEKSPDHESARRLGFKLLIHQARIRIKENDHNGLSLALGNAMAIAPDDPELHKELTGFKGILPLSHLRGGNRDEAVRLWEEELKQNPQDHRIVHNLAILYYWWAVNVEKNHKEAGSEDIQPVKASVAKPVRQKFVLEGKKLVEAGKQTVVEDEKTKMIDRLWKKSIGYWVMLMNIEDFWQEWKKEREGLCSVKITEEDIKELKHKLMDERFDKQFHDYVDQYKQNGRDKESARHEDYLTTLLLEKKTASYYREAIEKIKGLGIKIDGKIKRWELIRAIQEKEGNSPCIATEKSKDCKDKGNCYWGEYCVIGPSLWNEVVSPALPCGPLMFKEMGILSEVYKLVELICKTGDGNEKLLTMLEKLNQKNYSNANSGAINEKLGKLKIYLSPLGKAYILIDEQKRPEQAIDEWERLPQDVRDSVEGRYVCALAITGRGERFYQEGKINDALNDWSMARTYIRSWAIELVNRSLLVPLQDKIDGLVVDACEKEAKLLKQKDKIEDAIKILTWGLEIVDRKSFREMLAVFYCDMGTKKLNDKNFSAARKHFEKALSFDPDNKRAKQSIGTAYNNEGVSTGDADSSIPLFEKAIQYDPDSDVIKQNLTGAYNGKAVIILNSLTQYTKASRCDEAIDLLKKGIKLLNDSLDMSKLESFASTEEWQFNDLVRDWSDDLYKTMIRNIWIAYRSRRNLRGY